ncbi:MAG TPA: helix-turn-helix domain-containing protein [Acidimicrobiales bacterium]
MSKKGPTLMVMDEQLLRVREVARRLGLDGVVVYDLIAHGELAAGKGTDGMVYVRESALQDYHCRHPATTA